MSRFGIEKLAIVPSPVIALALAFAVFHLMKTFAACMGV